MEYVPRPRATDLTGLRSEIIRNAAFVAHEGQKARKLTRWLKKKEKRRVVFLFDTDIIKTYCAPWIIGPADDSALGNGYGQILPPRPFEQLSADERQGLLIEERRRAEGVAWLLAGKAFQAAFDLKMPILQAKSHCEETLRVYKRVKADARDEINLERTSAQDRQDRSISQTLRLVRAAVNRPSDISPETRNVGSYLSNVLNSIQGRDLQRFSRFVREWDAFIDVARRSGGILELSAFRPAAESFAPDLAVVWNEVAEKIQADEASKIDDLARSFEKLVVPEHHRLHRERGEDDSKALAEVAYADQLLSTMAPDTVRVVLITGDRKLVLALATARETLGTGDRTIAQFAFDHVHHLWSFVDTISADVFAWRSGGRAKEGERPWRSELFSGLLAFEDQQEPDAASEDQQESDAATLDRLARNACRAEPDLAERILLHDIEQAYQRWQEFSAGAANLHRHFLFDPEKNRQISQILIEKLKKRESDVDDDRLRALVVETMARARDRTNVEFSEIGANSILTAHQHGVRNPPDLMFESRSITDKIFTDLALPKRVFLNAEDFSERFKQIAADCYKPQSPFDDDYREECYLKYLVLGALFASANRWLVAEQHAESAIDIVVRAATLKDPVRVLRPSASALFPNINGREAYYLLAIASHVRASGMRSYDVAQDHLQEARACLEEDRKKGTAVRVPFIRFDCESLAIDLGRYYHARANNEDDPCNGHADRMFRTARKLLDVREAMQRNANDPAVAEGEKIGSLRASTKTSIATNLIQIAAIAQFRNNKNYAGKEVCPVDRPLLNGALDDLIQHTNLLSELARALNYDLPDSAPEAPAVICSPLTLLYAVVGAMLTGDRRIWTPKTQKDVDDLFASQQPNVTEHDPWRFDALRDFCKSALRR